MAKAPYDTGLLFGLKRLLIGASFYLIFEE